MIPVLDSGAMGQADRATIDGLGLPSMVLMEAAAWGVTEAVLERFDDVSRVAVVCGPGNNGGDGLAAARQLRGRGVEVDVFLLVDEGALRGDAAAQLGLARRFGVRVQPCSEGLGPLAVSLSDADVIVDALFGTGLDRALAGSMAEAVWLLNATPRPIVSVDIPSGLAGSLSHPIGPAVQATLTVTFAAAKPAHVLPPACWSCGGLIIADIGIPSGVLADHADLWLLETADVAAWLPRRMPDAHKGHFGHLGIVAGRAGRAGAAILAARSAVVGGAGLVTVATCPDALTAIQVAVPEAMVDMVPAGAGGDLADHDLSSFLTKLTSVAVGPGIGTGKDAAALVDHLIAEWPGPLVVDADALTVLVGRLESLRGRVAPTVLTPHPGELARLLGVDTAEVVNGRLEAARDVARRSGSVVVAKGARTLVVGGEGRDLVNPTGTPGLASGGTGDTLTGLIGALLAQGLDGPQAAGAATYLHGLAAELAGEAYPAAVPAGRVIESLPRAWAAVVSEADA